MKPSQSKSLSVTPQSFLKMFRHLQTLQKEQQLAHVNVKYGTISQGMTYVWLSTFNKKN